MSTSINRRKRRRQSQKGVWLEPLEVRQLLSGMLVSRRSLWTIRGDADPNNPNDTITVAYNPATRKIDVTVNGVVSSRRPGQLSAIQILSGAGDDNITVDTGKAGIAVTIRAGDGNDTIHCGAEADTVDGGAGNDFIDGDGGNDRLDGGEGDDTVIGGVGKNKVDGGAGTDILYAVKGRDSIRKDRFDSYINSNNPSLAQTLLPDPVASAPSGLNMDAIRQRLIDEAVARYRDLLGTHYLPYYYNWVWDYPMQLASAGSTTQAADVPPPNHSGTNNQVAGVEEGDMVQNDGNYLYTIRGNVLLVIDVREPSAPQIISTTEFTGIPNALYLSGHRVVVLTDGAMPSTTMSATSVWVFDVTTPGNPTLLEKSMLAGSVAASRMIGDQLYVVMRNDMELPAPQLIYESNNALTPDPGGTTFSATIPLLPWYGSPGRYQTEDEYRAFLATRVDDYLPWYSTTLTGGEVGATGTPLDHIEYLPDGASLTLATSVYNFDLSDSNTGPSSVAMALGAADTVYVSGEHLYAIGGDSPFGSVPSTSTHILKFDLGKGDVQFDATGDVSGLPLNSCSIDEYQGQLRIVTTTYTNWHESHSLYVLSDTGDQLTITGELDGIGDGENLRSVLFVQDRAYVVTFRTVDPLFAIDLSNAASPLMVGELVMPGFSTYLYPLDHDHLIGVGQGEGSQPGNFHNVQVTLYNVADLSNPFIVDQRLYEAPGAWGNTNSIAGYDPHAFAYFADSGVLAIPLSTWGSDGSNYKVAMLKVDPAAGFTDLGEVKHTTPVERSIQIGDNLFSLADGDLKVVTLLQPSHMLAEMLLPEWSPPNWGGGGIIIGPPIIMPPIWGPIGGPITIQPITLQPITVGFSNEVALAYLSPTAARGHHGTGQS